MEAETQKRVCRGVAILLWTAVSLYFGGGGWVRARLEARQADESATDSADSSGITGSIIYDGIPFKSIHEVRRYQALKEEETAAKYFPWAVKLPAPLGLVLTAGFFGALGGVTQLTFLYITKSADERVNMIIALPFFGFLIGQFFLALSFLVPAALIGKLGAPSATSVFVVSLLGGTFAEMAYRVIQRKAATLLGGGEDDNV